MVYIYKNEEGVVVYTRESEPSVEHITLERMIPKPVKAGYTAVLNADFQSGKVWFDLRKNPPTLEEVRAEKIAALEAYDKSASVNSYSIRGIEDWKTPAERTQLAATVNAEKASGKEETVLWLGLTPLTLNCDLVLQMLIQLEVYAHECFNVTAQHKANIMAIAPVGENPDYDALKKQIEDYDFTAGYPSKLDF